MFAHFLPILEPSRCAWLLILFSCTSLAPAKTTSCDFSDRESLTDISAAEERLHRLIMERGRRIQHNLTEIVDRESAHHVLPELQQDYSIICQYFAQIHQLRERGYHLSRIKKNSRESTRLFGRICLISMDLLNSNAYGCAELAQLLKKLCPRSYDPLKKATARINAPR